MIRSGSLEVTGTHDESGIGGTMGIKMFIELGLQRMGRDDVDTVCIDRFQSFLC